MKKILKCLFPNLTKKLTGLVYGWKGCYSSWQEAASKSKGYDSSYILEKVKASMLRVKSGEAVYERDSVLFDSVEYAYPLLADLMWIAAQKNGRLNILDFGGSLGSTYYQNKNFLDFLPDVNWCIVEQDHFVKEGKKHFQSDRLKFYHSVDDCLDDNAIDVVLFSSVLQYLEKPYELLDTVFKGNIEYVIVDRTAFISGEDRITIQKVHPSIYKGSYPCWFFNREKFLNFMNNKYTLVHEFDAIGEANIKSDFKGFLFKIKDN